MTPEETNILVRLDEKVANLYKIAEKNMNGIDEIKNHQTIHGEAIVQLATTLKGNGTKGLCERVNELETKHDKLQRVFWLVVGSLVASGALGAGLYELVKNVA